jgi:hypothetical protein
MLSPKPPCCPHCKSYFPFPRTSPVKRVLRATIHIIVAVWSVLVVLVVGTCLPWLLIDLVLGRTR